MNIPNKLKMLREEQGYNKRQLAHALGVAYTTYNNWETGARDTNSDVLTLLADFYGVSIDYIVGVTDIRGRLNPLLATADEHDHIKKYRGLDERGKGTVDNVINYEYEQTKNRKPTIIDLEPAAETEQPLTRQVPKAHLPASAGTGVYLHNSDYELIDIPDTPETKQVNFAVRISGDSMEPLYYDGDTVLVKQQPTVEIGEIGVFVMDGEGYVKKLGNGEFISLNKNYAPIPFKGDVYTSGKVIGKL